MITHSDDGPPVVSILSEIKLLQPLVTDPFSTRWSPPVVLITVYS